MINRQRLSISGAISFNDPTSFTGKGSKYIIHVSPSREWKVTVLAEAGKHAAGDGPAVSFSKLSSLLLFLSFFPAFGISISRTSATAGSGSGHCCREAAGPPGLRLLGVWLRIRGGGEVRVMRIQILVVRVIAGGGGAGGVVHFCCIFFFRLASLACSSKSIPSLLCF